MQRVNIGHITLLPPYTPKLGQYTEKTKSKTFICAKIQCRKVGLIAHYPPFLSTINILIIIFLNHYVK